jgi:leader peptidase (prepilin peptidase)/N-methyltransferase
MDTLLASFAGLVGVAVGSFLNVVAHRVPLGKSVLHPPSACPGCQTPIAPRDNIPLVSWILLRGRCRHCGTAISIRYPMLELAGGIVWVGIFLSVGLSWVLPAYLWFGSVTLALIATDLEHHRLPNRIVFVGLTVGTVLLAVGALLDGQPGGRLGWAALGGALYFAFMLLLAIVARGGFGFGDVKMAALLGLCVSYQPMTEDLGATAAFGALGVAAFGSFFIGGLVAVVLLVLRKRGRKQEIAFGPAMILAAWFATIWGAEVFSTYVGLS